ncbi:MAG: hypothetical protein K0S53_3220 [Bacteroidetes bacterium]|jgi:hypothetical protein|nr:hypothetical protein [Bacteroidota bacterium]MDF2453265.1 hypothetical protein [Bacteroidota bacterium]
MKKIIILMLVLLCGYSCIKKDALKYDPELVGEWVGYEDNVYTWLTINSDGQGHYSTNGSDEADQSGSVKYSLFEKKMWIGGKKFKIAKWITGVTDGVSSVETKEKETLRDTVYDIDMKMVLETTGIMAHRSVTLYRTKQ